MNALMNNSIISQFIASLEMLEYCINKCPESEWDKRHNDYPFSQVLFHTLFDCDYCLCDVEDELIQQAFHKENASIFGNYPELGDQRSENTYDRVFINKYTIHCKTKVVEKISTKSIDELIEGKADVTRSMTKLERYINGIRHIQHHLAQLGLRLQYIKGNEMEWIGRTNP